ncbi:EAL domain-containing protein [Rhodanobacter lindaniclasticus]
MQRRFATTIALALCGLAIVLPMAAMLVLAHRQSVEESGEQAAGIASGIIQRTEAAGNQSTAAYQRLSQFKASDSCTEAKRAELRRVLLDYDYVQAIGYVADDHITCSAIGPKGDGLDMGPPTYVSPMGTRVHVAVSIDGSRPFVVLSADSYAAAVHPDALLADASHVPGLAQGVYGRSAGKLWAHRGVFDPAWLARHGQAAQAIFYDGHYLVAIQASSKYDVAAYAAIPRAYLNARLRSVMFVLLPIGLVLGLAMAAAIIMLARQRTSLPALLRSALKRKEFVMYYQPIVELDGGGMVGAEALLRWPSNRELGMRPALLIQAAEECGLIHRFTEYVLDQVASDGPRFFRLHPGAYISVNLASVDLASDEVVEWLRRVVTTPGIAPYNLVVEVTEYSFIDPERANHVINRIRALGVRVAIDDFGTGFSSLSHLNNLSADYLKIDKVFVDAIDTGSVTSEVVLHIINMAKSLNLTLISEGVETQAQADFLRQRGVVFAQGWLFSKAVPLDELLASRPSAGA